MKAFAFKDFLIKQQNSPLKVSTDAILLGAAVSGILPNSHILDVGTGNGVIALMLAARFENVQITAIDPHAGAFIDAKTNFKNSKFSTRLKVLQLTLRQLPEQQLFDIIVSNPPYFLDSLASPAAHDAQAKHLTKASYFELLDDMHLHMTNEGQIWLILPAAVALSTIEYLEKKGFFCTQQIRFHANENKRDKRWVLCLEQSEKELQIEDRYIRNLDGSFHDDYRQLAGDFHDRPI